MNSRWANVEAQLADAEQRLRQTMASLDGLEGQAKRLNRVFRNGEISTALYEENRREIDEETQQLKERVIYLERLQRSLAEQLHGRDAFKEIFDLARRWDPITMAQRKYVLRNVVDSIVAFKPQKTQDIRLRVYWRFSDPASN